MENLEGEFFKFVLERQLIWYKRFVLKKESPWTEDAILRKYKIINVYRELDKCTLYILDKMNGVSDREKILINIIFYRFFNQFNLYEKLGIDIFDRLDDELKDILLARFDSLKEKGLPLFNNAYLISGVKGERKHYSILNNLRALDVGELIKEIDSAKSPVESFEVLMKIPMVGSFLACEIWTDLTYLKFFNEPWTDNDFVNIGPGSKWGLELIYGKLSRKDQYENLKHLYKIQKDFLKEDWKRIAYGGAFSNYPFLSITNIEGSLCEFRKYLNIKNGKGRRKYFHPRDIVD